MVLPLTTFDVLRPTILRRMVTLLDQGTKRSYTPLFPTKLFFTHYLTFVPKIESAEGSDRALLKEEVDTRMA